MKNKTIRSYFIAAVLLACLNISLSTMLHGQESVGNIGVFDYKLPPDWILNKDHTNEEFVTFSHISNGKSRYHVRIWQKGTVIKDENEFDLHIKILKEKQNNWQGTVDYSETQSSYPVLGMENCHTISYIAPAFNHREFIFHPVIDGMMYNLYVFDEFEKKKELQKEVIDFIAGISLSGQKPVEIETVATSADEELPPYILPVQDGDSPGPGAGFVLGMLEDPQALLDALGGGRPEGDIIALKALLRQAAGPLEEAADQAMNKDLEPYARTTSAKARQAVRRQGELLAQAMLRQQLLLHSAWEFEYAQANMEMAEAVGDKEEMAVQERIALVQRQEVELAKAGLDALATLADAAPAIPSLAELKAEEEELAQAMAESVEQLPPAEPATEIHGDKILVGYLKHDGSHVQKLEHTDFNTNVLKVPIEEQGIVKVEGKSLSYYMRDPAVVGKVTTYRHTFSWEAPEMIPLYAEKLYPGVNGVPQEWFTAAGDGFFNARLVDGGSSCSDGSSVTFVVEHGVGTSESVSNLGTVHFAPLLSTDPAKKAVQERIDIKISEQNQPRYLYIAFKYGHMWTVSERYRWEPHDFASGAPALTADAASDDAGKFNPLAEHEANIAVDEKWLVRVRREMAAETDPERHKELRYQALHLEQNIHDSRDIMESIRTGEFVKTRGPWDEHAAVVLARTSQQMADEAARAKELQASYIRCTKELEKYDPDLAKHYFDVMDENMITDIYRPGRMEHAKAFYKELHTHTMSHARDQQAKLEKDQDRAFVDAVRASKNLEYLETLKSGCDKAIFVGSLAMGTPGLALGMAYEGATTTVDKGLRAAVKNMAVQGTLILGGMAVIKGGGWTICKFLNPKVTTPNPQSFRNMLEANRAAQELEWNRNLVNRLKESAAAVERSKAAGGKGYLSARTSLDEAVKAVDGSFLAKDLMKNEFKSAMAGANSTAGRARLQGVLSYQNAYTGRLQEHIHPHVDRKFVTALRRQGYNVEQSWFREFRNASSKGANRDRDLGLLSQYERIVTKDGKSISMNQFMRDAQKSYDAAYKEVTGRSARLADQNITTTMHRESFPISWLDGRFLQETGTPKDFVAGGRAIYAKVSNALAGPDPYFVNLKKASSSLSKDLGTKVIPALRTPGVGKGLTPTARQAATEHWTGVQKILDDFATDKVDPLTTMKRLREYTGHSSILESAAEVRKVLAKLGGV
jgi:hypothetical protein